MKALSAVVVGKAGHVHAYDGVKTIRSNRGHTTPRTVCGQVFDRHLGSWEVQYATPKCAKCEKILGERDFL